FCEDSQTFSGLSGLPVRLGQPNQMGGDRDLCPGGPKVGEAATHLSDSIKCFSLFSPGPTAGYRHYSAPERQSLLFRKGQPFIREFSYSHRISVPLIDRRRARQGERFTLGVRSFKTKPEKFLCMGERLFGVTEKPERKGEKNFNKHSRFMSVRPGQ